MNIVLNEKKRALDIIKNGNLGLEKGRNRILLVKYYNSIGMTKDLIRKTLEEFLVKYDKEINVDESGTADYIDSIVKRYSSDKYPLKKTVINISQNELNKIKEINNKNLESLLFIMMIYAKSNNSTWANMKIKDLFKYAKIKQTMGVQDNMLHKLFIKGYFKLSNKCDKLGLNLKFLDKDCNNNPIIVIEDDLKEALLHYKKWKGEKIIECEECGIMVEVKTLNNKYCKKCAKKKQSIHEKNSRKKIKL